jgi:hypothetical protein
MRGGSAHGGSAPLEPRAVVAGSLATDYRLVPQPA